MCTSAFGTGVDNIAVSDGMPHATTFISDDEQLADRMQFEDACH
jgi:hypothetical protein